MNNPVIVISGFGQSNIVLEDENGVKIKNLWPFELKSDAIADRLKGSLMKMMLFRKDAGFSDSVAKIVSDMSEDIKLNSDGTRNGNVVVKEYNKSFAEYDETEKAGILKSIPLDVLSEKTGEDKLYFFTYDFFGDAYKEAEKLDKFVENVKASHRSEKVDFVCLCLGGVVLRAYLDLFANKNDVANVVGIACMFDGSTLIADILEDKIKLDNPTELLSLLGEKGASLSGVVGMLPPDVIENTVKKSLDVFKKNLILNSTMMWGAIPAARFSKVSAGYPEMNDSVKAKAQKIADASLNLSSYGVKIFAVCGSSIEMIPVCESKEADTDGILSVSAASVGADGDAVCRIENLSHLAAIRSKESFGIAAKILSGEV